MDRFTLEDLVRHSDITYEVLQGYYFDQGRNDRVNAVIREMFDARLEYKRQGSPLQLVLAGVYHLDVPPGNIPLSALAGLRANPFHAQLAKRSGTPPGWNFHKYLVDRGGNRIQSFPTVVRPDDPKLVREIERLLAEGVGAGR